MPWRETEYDGVQGAGDFGRSISSSTGVTGSGIYKGVRKSQQLAMVW